VDTIDHAEHDLLRRRNDGLGARTADAIDGHRWHVHRQTAMIATCRAGFILLPAWITLPMTAVLILARSSFALARVALITVAPSSLAGTALREPLNVPIAVRTGAHKTTSRWTVIATPSSEAAG
jgi:hypothetical protein